ncbi:heavy metal-associated isoprenylated plant protein 47-like isoform X2 [Magnolia sinica]|uniref:heavy metal-associated isoprenylated plant protein 47-like isoform X2 n=1 Tax=Magnolia sinica TaxID=86752 RepID=UPI00265AC375|nr:heavy metal-associated isoprenylated plant protein 47-like isoform X2 [Magnolia sinica]
MKKKIVMEVQMSCEKCRTKAMEVAASMEGVTSVAIGGNENERIVVEGEGVDPADLACLMKKKVGRTKLITVEDVKPKEEKESKKEEDEKDHPPQWIQHYYQYPQYVAVHETVYDPSPSVCSLM